MNRRSFLKRLGAVAAAAGLAAADPPAVGAATAAPATEPPALDGRAVALATEAPTVPEGCIVYDEATGSFLKRTAGGWEPFTFPTAAAPPPGSTRRAFASLAEGERRRVLRNSLAKLGALGDDAFLPGTDEVIWRWEQVRQTVMRTYGKDAAGSYYRKRIIALPAVCDALFVAGEPGHAEWLTVRATFLAMADRASAV